MKSGLLGIKPWNHKHCELLHLLDTPMLPLCASHRIFLHQWSLCTLLTSPLPCPFDFSISNGSLCSDYMCFLFCFFFFQNTMVFTVLLTTPFPVTKFSKLWSTWPLFPHISFTLSHSPCNWNFTLKIYQQLPNSQIFVSSLILLSLHTKIGIFIIIYFFKYSPSWLFPSWSSFYSILLIFNLLWKSSLPLSYMFQQFQPLLSLFMDFRASFIHGQEDPYIISAALIFVFQPGTHVFNGMVDGTTLMLWRFLKHSPNQTHYYPNALNIFPLHSHCLSMKCIYEAQISI